MQAFAAIHAPHKHTLSCSRNIQLQYTRRISLNEQTLAPKGKGIWD